MKKVILAAIGCLMMGAIEAREVTYNVYYNEITTIRGELYQYSERYLGTTDVIMEDSHRYELNKIKQVREDTTSSNGATTSNQNATGLKTSVKKQLPLSEETLLATNLAKKAESVAKQIYRIREIRMNILSGDVEHMPADGKAMQLVLDELNKQEEALTSMFVGKTIVKSCRQSIPVNINDQDKAIKMTLVKFSTEQGLLSQKAENGEPVELIVTRRSESVLVPPTTKKGASTYEEKIVSSRTVITYKNKTLYAQTCNH